MFFERKKKSIMQYNFINFGMLDQFNCKRWKDEQWRWHGFSFFNYHYFHQHKV